MYTALQDIKIDKIDFQWIQSTTKLSHLKRAIHIIELDGNYYTELKDACYKRIEELDPTQRRVNVSNAVSAEFRKEIQCELLEWERGFQEGKGKQGDNSSSVMEEKGENKEKQEEELKDFESYFNNESKPTTQHHRLKLAQAQRTKGNEAIKSKDFKQAIAYYTTSLTLCPTMHQSLSNRALAHLKLKDYQKCIDDCQGAMTIDPTHVKAYHRKAKALVGMGRKVEAYRCLQQGQRIEPDNVELTKELKELREEMTPAEIKELDSHLIPKSQFKKVVIEEDSQDEMEEGK